MISPTPLPHAARRWEYFPHTVATAINQSSGPNALTTKTRVYDLSKTVITATMPKAMFTLRSCGPRLSWSCTMAVVFSVMAGGLRSQISRRRNNNKQKSKWDYCRCELEPDQQQLSILLDLKVASNGTQEGLDGVTLSAWNHHSTRWGNQEEKSFWRNHAMWRITKSANSRDINICKGVRAHETRRQLWRINESNSLEDAFVSTS